MLKTKTEFCPECGEFVLYLDRNTGWCTTCTALINNNTRTAIEAFLYANADHIEHYILRGKSFNQAIESLRDEIAKYRTCASCGALIKRGGPAAIFCRKTEACRKASRKYVYLYDRKGLTKSQALNEVLATINGSE